MERVSDRGALLGMGRMDQDPSRIREYRALRMGRWIGPPADRVLTLN